MNSLTNRQLMKAIKDAASDYTKEFAAESKADEFSFARVNGVPTWHISQHLKIPCSILRKALRKLQAEGLVYGFSKRGNQIRWWPVGFMNELKAAKQAGAA